MQNTPFVRVFLYTSVTVDHTRTLLGRHHQRAGTPFVIPVHGCNWTIQGLYWDGTAHVQDTLCQSIPVCYSNCGPYQDSPGLAQPARRIPLCQSIPVCWSNCRPYRDSLRMAPSACRIPLLSEYPCIPGVTVDHTGTVLGLHHPCAEYSFVRVSLLTVHLGFPVQLWQTISCLHVKI